MFKYSAPSTQPLVAPEFHGIPEFSGEGDEKTGDRPDLTIVRAPSASPPRLRGADAEDHADLMIPEILRKQMDDAVDQPLEGAWSKPEAGGFGRGSVAAASAAGLLLVVAGGLMLYAAGGTSGKDVRTVPVKTISLDGQASANPVGATGVGSAAGVQAPALDKSGFEQRFNSAKAADSNPGALKIKSQDRVAKIPLGQDGTAGVVRNVVASTRPGTRSHLPVLGYASVPNPHAGWDEGQSAISSAAGKAASKGARGVGGSRDGTEIAAAQPIAAPTAPAARLAADPGQMTETSTVTADVNLRSAGEKDAPVLTVVPKGTSVGVGACDNWWCAVNFDGQTGFVGKKFVDGKG